MNPNRTISLSRRYLVILPVFVLILSAAFMTLLTAQASGYERRIAELSVWQRSGEQVGGGVMLVAAKTSSDVQVGETEPIVPVIQTVYVPRIEYRERVVFESQPLKSWQSLDEFAAIYKGASAPLSGGACLSVAELIQQDAMGRGYPVSVVFAQNGIYYSHVVTSIRAPHAIVAINVGGTYYAIEPQTWEVTELW